MTSRELRTSHTWSKIAGITLQVEEVDGQFYAYGKELACLRLEHKFNNAKARAAYSENLDTWYFTIDREN